MGTARYSSELKRHQLVILITNLLLLYEYSYKKYKGTIYLPFVADRDKLRGLFEEGEETIPEGARREIQRIAKIEAEQQKELQQQLQKYEQEKDYSLQKQKKASAGGMWSATER